MARGFSIDVTDASYGDACQEVGMEKAFVIEKAVVLVDT
jgi:hypothetical protein